MNDTHENYEMLDTDDEMLENVELFPSQEELEFPTMIATDNNVSEEPPAFQLESEFYDPEKQEDHLWMARTGLNKESLCGAIETVIFMSDKPVALNKIRAVIDEDMPLRVVHEALTRLQSEYESKHHGIRLVEVAEGYQFRTKATYSKYVQDLFKVNSLVLSPTALEVLAIIAYRQPVAKTEVDKVRGVDSSHIVRALMDKRLVRVVGRSDEVGRPVLYGTTPEFLEVFNLANINELPPEHELESMSQQNVGKISDIKTLVHTGDKEKFKFDEISELDELTEAIKSISPDTEFTKSLLNEEKKRVEQSSESVRTAFELLEEFLLKQVHETQNKIASESELFSAFTDPKIITDLEAGPFNLPELDDKFEMIDLDTGESIDDEDTLMAEDLIQSEDLEAEELSRALDDAFSRLTGEELNDEMEDLDEDFNNLNELTDDMVAKAQDLDLDLSFLKNEIPTGSEEENFESFDKE
ncbi:MAG: hypothetical protein Fur0010_22650 [Bdellovibrio sp.]